MSAVPTTEVNELESKTKDLDLNNSSTKPDSTKAGGLKLKVQKVQKVQMMMKAKKKLEQMDPLPPQTRRRKRKRVIRRRRN